MITTQRGPAAALLLLLVASPALADPAAETGDAKTKTMKREAYLLYSLAQQSLLQRDYRLALEQLEEAASRDASPALLLELARLRFSLNDLEGAAGLARRVLQGADGAEAHRLLGDIYLIRAREGIDPEADVSRAVEEYRTALSARPEDEEARRSLAEIHYHLGQFDEVRELLDEPPGRKPLPPPLALLLGKSLVRAGQYERAEEILSDLAARSPGNPEAADALAALFEGRKMYDQAIAVYEGLSRAGTAEGPYLKERIGWLHFQAGRYREAIGALDEGRVMDPQDPRGLLTLGQAHEAIGASEQALARYDDLLRLEPANLEARFHRARLLRKEQGSEEALQAFRQLADLGAARDSLTEREAIVLALTHAQVGIIEIGSRNYEAAAAALAQAVGALQEPDADLYALLARAHLGYGNLEDALTVTEEAASRHPAELEVAIVRGEILVAEGDLARARELYGKLVRERGGTAEAYARVSEALLRSRRFEAADEFLSEGTRLHPADDGLIFARGAVMERLGRLKEAERLLGKAIRLNPKNAMALNYLGYMLAEQGIRLHDSIAYVRRALELEPKNPAYLDSLGWVQLRMSLFGPAEQSLRDAVRYDHADPTIREHLGDLLMETGRAAEAVREWQSALARGHEDPERVRKKITGALGSPKGRR
jgi:tetratricopeptide (TPR) repeat protein